MKSENRMDIGYLGEYLQWRGDLTFAQAPFCAADSLMLTMLSYLTPEKVTVPGEKNVGIRLGELARRYDLFYVPEKNPGRLSMTARAPELLKRMASTVRFSGVVLEDYSNHTDIAQDGRFAAMTFSAGKDSIYIAYRGTDNNIIGWKEDFNMSYLESVPAQKRAADYLKKQAGARVSAGTFSGKIMTGGHSKGGNLAVYAAVCADEKTAERIVEVHNFDGPGFSEEFFRLPGYPSVKNKIINFLPQGSLVGRLFEHRGKMCIVRSEARGILQHIPFSWKIRGGNFVFEEEFDRSSQIFDDMMTAWISGKNDEEKKVFIDGVFDLLEEYGIDTTEELKHDLTKVRPVFKLLKGMPKEDRDVFFRFMAALLREAGLAVQKNLFGNEEATDSSEKEAADFRQSDITPGE